MLWKSGHRLKKLKVSPSLNSIWTNRVRQTECVSQNRWKSGWRAGESTDGKCTKGNWEIVIRWCHSELDREPHAWALPARACWTQVHDGVDSVLGAPPAGWLSPLPSTSLRDRSHGLIQVSHSISYDCLQCWFEFITPILLLFLYPYFSDKPWVL